AMWFAAKIIGVYLWACPGHALPWDHHQIAIGTQRRYGAAGHIYHYSRFQAANNRYARQFLFPFLHVIQIGCAPIAFWPAITVALIVVNQAIPYGLIGDFLQMAVDGGINII